MNDTKISADDSETSQNVDELSKKLYEPETDMEFADIISANKCPTCERRNTYKCVDDTSETIYLLHTQVHIERYNLWIENKIKQIKSTAAS